jgi:hypothetical protein
VSSPNTVHLPTRSPFSLPLSTLIHGFPILALRNRHPSTYYLLPGTNHAVIIGDSSNDALRQYAYIQTAINDAAANHPVSPDPDATKTSDLPTANAAEADNLRQAPYCFVADTDSIPYVIDTGANRVIINNAKLFHEFRPTNGKVKGIGGTPVSLNGIGTVKLPLRSDDGTVDQVILRNAVYVPSSPFNLIPPQLLIAEWKHSGFHVDYFEHDDKEYIFNYKPDASAKEPRKLTVPVGSNNLFALQSNDGYTGFFKQAKNFEPDWCMFAGAAHIIPETGKTQKKCRIRGRLLLIHNRRTNRGSLQ